MGTTEVTDIHILPLSLIALLLFMPGCFDTNDKETIIDAMSILVDYMNHLSNGNYTSAISMLISQKGERVEDEKLIERFIFELYNCYASDGESLNEAIVSMNNSESFSSDGLKGIITVFMLHFPDYNNSFFVPVIFFYNSWGILYDDNGGIPNVLMIGPKIPKTGDLSINIGLESEKCSVNKTSFLIDLTVVNNLDCPLIIRDFPEISWNIVYQDGPDIKITTMPFLHGDMDINHVLLKGHDKIDHQWDLKKISFYYFEEEWDKENESYYLNYTAPFEWDLIGHYYIYVDCYHYAGAIDRSNYATFVIEN